MRALLVALVLASGAYADDAEILRAWGEANPAVQPQRSIPVVVLPPPMPVFVNPFETAPQVDEQNERRCTVQPNVTLSGRLVNYSINCQ